MSKRISKEKAIELITPVVDDEIEKDLRIAFFEYIEDDDEVRIQYESAKRIKKLVSSRYPNVEAPDSLRDRVQDYLSSVHMKENQDSGNEEKSFIDKPVSSTPNQSTENPDSTGQNTGSFSIRNGIVAAAVILVVALGFVLYGIQSPTYDLGEYVYTHFNTHQGELMEPTITTSNLAEAEIRLGQMFDLALTIPPVENGEFVGIAYIDFVPGFKTPILEYHLPDENQNIFIFAFNIKQLSNFGKLIRDREAIKSCQKPSDFHIRKINDKELVHWKWNGTWYTAISNHKGAKLASFITPLQNNTP